MPQFTDFISFPTAKVWDDCMGPLNGLALAASPPAVTQYGSSGPIRTYAFNINDGIGGAIQFPHGWAEGTDIEPHVHWAPITTSTNNVLWTLTYYWQNVGDGTVGAPTSIVTPSQAGSGIAFAHQLLEFPAIVGTGKTVSSILTFDLIRTTSAAPAMAGRVMLLSFDIHIQKDSIGSRQELVK